MLRLIDEIIDTLEDKGFSCSRQLRYDLEVICVKMPAEKSPRIILPIEIKSRSVEEAHLYSTRIREAVSFIKSTEGYPLIITEDRWKAQRAMTQERLLAHLEIFSSVFARNCEVRRIDKAEARTFLEETHSYGYAACRYRYGLFLKHTDSLIAVATFSNARRWVKDGKEIRSYEWTRYASVPFVRISGGMGKLLKAFINEVNPDDIMSYADLEWSEGEVYRTLGFQRESEKEPVSFIIDPFTYKRTAIRDKCPDDRTLLYFQNLGSAKYRLKLTDHSL